MQTLFNAVFVRLFSVAVSDEPISQLANNDPTLSNVNLFESHVNDYQAVALAELAKHTT